MKRRIWPIHPALILFAFIILLSLIAIQVSKPHKIESTALVGILKSGEPFPMGTSSKPLQQIQLSSCRYENPNKILIESRGAGKTSGKPICDIDKHALYIFRMGKASKSSFNRSHNHQQKKRIREMSIDVTLNNTADRRHTKMPKIQPEGCMENHGNPTNLSPELLNNQPDLTTGNSSFYSLETVGALEEPPDISPEQEDLLLMSPNTEPSAASGPVPSEELLLETAEQKIPQMAEPRPLEAAMIGPQIAVDWESFSNPSDDSANCTDDTAEDDLSQKLLKFSFARGSTPNTSRSGATFQFPAKHLPRGGMEAKTADFMYRQLEQELETIEKMYQPLVPGQCVLTKAHQPTAGPSQSTRTIHSRKVSKGKKSNSNKIHLNPRSHASTPLFSSADFSTSPLTPGFTHRDSSITSKSQTTRKRSKDETSMQTPKSQQKFSISAIKQEALGPFKTRQPPNKRKHTEMISNQVEIRAKLDEAREVKRKRDLEFPMKAAILHARYHEEYRLMTWPELDIIRNFLDAQLSSYLGPDGPLEKGEGPEVAFSSDMRIRAGMIVIDCRDEDSIIWLETTIEDLCVNNSRLLPNQEGENDSSNLKCLDMEDAKPFKTYLLTHKDIHASQEEILTDVRKKAGFTTKDWIICSKNISNVQTLTFIDTEDHLKEKIPSTRFIQFRSQLGGLHFSIRWLRGEDESGKAINRTLFNNSTNKHSFKEKPSSMLGRTSSSRRSTIRPKWLQSELKGRRERRQTWKPTNSSAETSATLEANRFHSWSQLSRFTQFLKSYLKLRKQRCELFCKNLPRVDQSLSKHKYPSKAGRQESLSLAKLYPSNEIKGKQKLNRDFSWEGEVLPLLRHSSPSPSVILCGISVELQSFSDLAPKGTETSRNELSFSCSHLEISNLTTTSSSPALSNVAHHSPFITNRNFSDTLGTQKPSPYAYRKATEPIVETSYLQTVFLQLNVANSSSFTSITASYHLSLIAGDFNSCSTITSSDGQPSSVNSNENHSDAVSLHDKPSLDHCSIKVVKETHAINHLDFRGGKDFNSYSPGQASLSPSLHPRMISLSLLVLACTVYAATHNSPGALPTHSNSSRASPSTTTSISITQTPSDASTHRDSTYNSSAAHIAQAFNDSHSIEIGQYNLHKSPKAVIELNSAMNDPTDPINPKILLLQESPYKSNITQGVTLSALPTSKLNSNNKPVAVNPRAAVYINETLKNKNGAILLDNFTTIDQAAVALKLELDKGDFINLVVCSLYLPSGVSSTAMITEELSLLLQHCKETGAELIIGADSNSHHRRWGSDISNSRGETLLNFFDQFDMDILNIGDKPTFVRNKTKRDSPSSTIDVTFCSKGLRNLIKNWEVSEDLLESDHKYIHFQLNSRRFDEPSHRPKRHTNWKKFTKILESSEVLKSIGKLDPNMTITQLNTTADLFKTTVTDALDSSCRPRKSKLIFRQTWYNKSLYMMKKKMKKTYRRFMKTGNCSYAIKFRALRSKYGRRCKKAKLCHWKVFLHKLNSSKELARMQKFMENGKTESLTTIIKSDGTYTKNQAETQSELVKSHFKGATVLTKEEAWPDILPDPIQLSTCDKENIKTCILTPKIRWALQSFQPYKSPGTDEIFPALLQKAIETVIDPLHTLFMASLLTGYIPMAWRGSKVTFIPKPGKDSYGSASSYRPISLMSFVLKTLEKLIDKHLRYVELRNNPLDENQHAYRAGRSTDSAVHALLHKLEDGLERGLYGLFVFIDIAGAFDVTSVECVAKAAADKGVSPWCTRWMVSMLKNRQIETSNEHCDDRFVPHRGVAQGGVTSPLAFSLVADSLIKLLKGLGLTCIGYADDLAIGFSHSNLERCTSQLNRAMKAIEKWCIETGLDVNPGKTQMVCFTNKRIFFKTPKRHQPAGCPRNKHKSAKRVINKLHLIQPDNPYGERTCKIRKVMLKGQELLLTNSVKYLGVHLDSKLNMNAHINETIRKAKNSYWALSRMCKRNWGLRPSRSLYIIRNIIIPRITYGSIAFWHKIDPDFPGNLTRIEKINSIFNGILTRALGLLRTTPTVPLMSILDLNPICFEIKRRAIECYTRLENSGTWQGGHNQYGHKAIKKFTAKTLGDHRSELTSLKWRTDNTFRISTGIRTSLPTEGINVFTDGSASNSGSGVGVHCPQLDIDRSFKLANPTSSNQAERIALLKTAELISNAKVPSDKHIYIWSDSLSAVKSLGCPATNNVSEWECSELLNKLSSPGGPFPGITVGWLPKKANFASAQRADYLAKKSCNSELPPDILTAPHHQPLQNHLTAGCLNPKSVSGENL